MIAITGAFQELIIKQSIPIDSILVVPSIPVITVNAYHVNVQEPSDNNNLQNQKYISSDEKVTMLLKKVPSSRINKSDYEVFINIFPNTPVNTVFVYHGSVETPSELCETPCSSFSQSKKKDRQRGYQKQKRVEEIYLIDDIK